jgi:hypothetical protein
MNIQRSFVSVGLIAGLMCGLIGGALSGARADTPGEHPHYLRALSDLRYARAWLTALGENNVMGREMDAVVNIDKAIGDIKRASIDDGKDLNDHPPVDAKIKHKGRLHKVMALLSSARKDLRFKEDDKAALGWRKAALEHVNDAAKADKQAINDVRNDS